MEGRVLDDVNFEKKKAIARFNRFRIIVKVWQIFQVLVGFGMISWSSAHVPAVVKTTGGYIVEFSAYLFNQHVVFLLGNAIIVALVLLCRQNDDLNISADCGDLYDDYVKYDEEVRQREITSAPPLDEKAHSGSDKKQALGRTEENKANTQFDDVAVAIENATKLINKFQKIRSDKLKREIEVERQPELRKSETINHRKTVNSLCGDAEIENLSSEEFRRRVDAFIDKHWSSKPTKRNHFTGEKYRLLKVT